MKIIKRHNATLNYIMLVAVAITISCTAHKKENDDVFDQSKAIRTVKADSLTIDNLCVLGQVWGFMKYYHPAIAEGKYNWDAKLFRLIPAILSSRDITERNSVLAGLIDKLGPLPENKRGEYIGGEIKMKPDIAWIGDEARLGKKLSKQLQKIEYATRPMEAYYVGLGEGVGNAVFKNETEYKQMDYNDVRYRLLALFRYWNMIEYFYPYKYLIGENWHDVLKEFIPRFLATTNELEYKLAVQRLLASIHDSHAGFWIKDSAVVAYRGENFAPVYTRFIEDKLVVEKDVKNKDGIVCGLKRGDIILSVDNKPVDDIVRENLPYCSASNYPTALRNISPNIIRTTKGSIRVSVLRNQATISMTVPCINYKQFNDDNNDPAGFRFVAPKIACIYPGNFPDSLLDKTIVSLRETRGLIIDFRCYPSSFTVFSLGAFLASSEKEFVKFTEARIAHPGYFIVSRPLKVQATKDHYTGKVVILVNEFTQSSAEYHVMSFRQAEGAVVIGSTTAGADGNVSEIVLPGGVHTGISGIGVYWPDGRETQRVGIIPDIEVHQTIKGFIAGRDELMEKAIAVINGK